MAHVTEIVGKYSEAVARLALMSNGWEVASPEVDESYDIVAKDPLTKDWATFQCKTIRRRADRGNELVVYAKNGKGEPYGKSDADYIIGVLGADGEVPRVWYFENRSITEYWASEARASERWVELSIVLNRDLLTEIGDSNANNESEAV